MLIRIIAILFPLFAIAALGFWCARRERLDLSSANKLNMDVFTPALVFSALSARSFHVQEHLWLAGATVLLILACGAGAWAVARLTGLSAKTLMLPTMFNNSANLGLPLAVFAFGPDALAPAVVMFVVCNLMQFSLGLWLMDPQHSAASMLRNPNVLAAALGVALSMSGVTVWPPLLSAVQMVGQIAIPLMLFSLGARLAASRIEAVEVGLFGAALRPVLGMGFAWILARLLPLPGHEGAMLFVFGALPPAVLNFIFAERYNHEPDKVASIVLIGHLAALVFLPVALWVGL
jgi:predicted permease